MKNLKLLKAWRSLSMLCFLSGLAVFLGPSVIHASPPNVVLSRAIHFPTVAGNPVTLSPGKYFVEQAGATELRLTSAENNQKFLIQAKTLSHEQYELFSAMALTRPKKNDEFLIELFLPGGVRLEATGSTQALSSSPTLKEQPQNPQIVESSSPPVDPKPTEDNHVAGIIRNPDPPPSLQTPQVHDRIPPAPIVSSATGLIPYQAPYPDHPGLRIDSVNTDKTPSIFTLSPNHVGHTSHEHPILYWYLSQGTDYPLDVAMVEEGTVDALLNIRLLPPIQAGIHELRLEDYNVSLPLNVPYRWTVRILSPQTPESSRASGVIQRVDSLVDSSAYSPQEFAQKGQWYDALMALNRLIQENPENTDLLVQRTSLLNQVGLTKVSAFEQQAKRP